MIRIMLVDDEQYYFRFLKNLIEEIDNDFCVVGEAFDGLEALEKIPDVVPDIILTDIRMPVMDGLKLIEEVKKNYPNIICVITSAYPDFEYMRKAIQLSTEDYLLKPVTNKALEDLLPKLKQKYFTNNSQNEIKALQAAIYGEKTLPTSSNKVHNNYTIFLCCAGSYCKLNVDPINPGKVFWESVDISDKLNNVSQKGVDFWIFDGKRENEKILILGYAISEQIAAEKFLENIIQIIVGLNIPMTVVYKYNVASLNDISKTISSLRTVMIREIQFANSLVLNIDNVCNDKINADTSVIRKSFWEKMTLSLNSFEQKAIKKGLEELFGICENKKCTQIYLENVLKTLLVLLEKEKLLTGNYEIIQQNIQIDEMIANSVNYEELLEGVMYLLNDLLEQRSIVNEKNPHQKTMVNQIENYLKKNYNSMITVQVLAKEFGLVPKYLSSLFKKYKETTPGEYLTLLRIQKAVELMNAHPEMLLKQVSESVGYSDPLYFSRVFKKVTGKAPTDFLKGD